MPKSAIRDIICCFNNPFRAAKKAGLLRRDARWNLIFHSVSEDATAEAEFVDSDVQVTVIKSAMTNCAKVLDSNQREASFILFI